MELHLNPLRNRIIGIIDFKVKSPIHIGDGGTEARQGFLKVGGNLLIPASTWKGIFRSLSEKIAKNMHFTNYISNLAIKLYHEGVKGIEYKPKEEGDKKEFIKLEEELKKIYKDGKSEITALSKEDINQLIDELGFSDLSELFKKEDEGAWNKLTEAILAINCPIGKLYGNKYLASKIRFIDTFITTLKVYDRPGISIERKSGKVRNRSLYFKEVCTSGSVKAVFIADNLEPENDDSRIFLSTLYYIKEIGINIGGSVSKGLGYLEFENSKFYIIDLKEKNIEDKIIRLARPFKYIIPVGLDELTKWLACTQIKSK